MTDTHLADVSEFQEQVDAPLYIAAGHDCLIARAHNGHRPDKEWPERRDYLRHHPFTAVGYYQYIVAGRDAVAQAREFIQTVGPLRDNEFPIGDLEEGSGDQTPRAQAWLRLVDAWAGFPATLYSGEAFMRSQLSGSTHWRGRPRWIAAYRNREPIDAHELWQHTDQARFVGIGGVVDGNVFHGTAQQFRSVFCARPTSPSLPAETAAMGVGTMPDGRQEIFVELAGGEIQHRWNAEDGGWVDGWHSLGRPGGA